MNETDFELAAECDPMQPAFWARCIELELGLLPLSDVRSAEPSQGVSRFIDCGEDSPDWVLTCAWYRGGVLVECVSAMAGLGSNAIEEQWRCWLPIGLLPRPLRNWGRVRPFAAGAGSCAGERMIGGTLCYHCLNDAGTKVVVEWASPDPREHRNQLELIRAYRRLGVVGWLCSWFCNGQVSRRENRRT